MQNLLAAIKIIIFGGTSAAIDPHPGSDLLKRDSVSYLLKRDGVSTIQKAH